MTELTTEEKTESILYAIADLVAAGDTLTFSGDSGFGTATLSRRDGSIARVGDSFDVFIEHLYELLVTGDGSAWEKPSLLGGSQPLSVPLLVFDEEEWGEIEELATQIPAHIYNPLVHGAVLVSEETYQSISERYTPEQVARAFELHDFRYPRIAIELVEHEIHPFWFALEQASLGVKDEHELPEGSEQTTPPPTTQDPIQWA